MENRIVNGNKYTDTTESVNYDFDLPADTVEQLQRIDRQLQDKDVAIEMVYIYTIFILYLRVRSVPFKLFYSNCDTRANILDICIYITTLITVSDEIRPFLLQE